MSVPLDNEKEIDKLISDCLAHKQKAQFTLFKRYYSAMMNVCLRYADGYEEAQDMLNEGFIKIFANLDKYRDTGSFGAWMKRVMANAALDYQRKYHKSGVSSVSYDMVPEMEMTEKIENSAPGKLSYDELMSCIQQLPMMSKNVFNLYVFENYTHQEIAEMLGIKEGTSHWHLNFARNRLKILISQMENPDHRP